MMNEEEQPLAGAATTIGLIDDDILSRNLYGIDNNNDVNSTSQHHNRGGTASVQSLDAQLRHWCIRVARASIAPIIGILILAPLNFGLLPLIGIGVSSTCGNEAALTAAAAAYSARFRVEQQQQQQQQLHASIQTTTMRTLPLATVVQNDEQHDIFGGQQKAAEAGILAAAENKESKSQSVTTKTANFESGRHRRQRSAADGNATTAALNDMIGSEAFSAAAHRFSLAIRQAVIVDSVIQLLQTFFLIGVYLCVAQLVVMCGQTIGPMLAHSVHHASGYCVVHINPDDVERLLLAKCFAPARALFYFTCTYMAFCSFEKLYLLLSHCDAPSVFWSASISLLFVAIIIVAAAAVIDEQFRRMLKQHASVIANKSSTLLTTARDRYQQLQNSAAQQQQGGVQLHNEMNSGINGYVRRHERQQMGFESGQALLP